MACVRTHALQPCTRAHLRRHVYTWLPCFTSLDQLTASFTPWRHKENMWGMYFSRTYACENHNIPLGLGWQGGGTQKNMHTDCRHRENKEQYLTREKILFGTFLLSDLYWQLKPRLYSPLTKKEKMWGRLRWSFAS